MSLTGKRSRRTAAVLAVVSVVLMPLSACASGDSAASGKETLTIAVPLAPQSLDPSIASGGQQTIFQDTAYQSLFRTEGNSGVAPSLASGYEWVGDGNTTLKVKLRPDIKFSDGETLDSSAVKTWIEHFQEQGGPHAYAAAAIESIETPDELTVVFNLSAPTPQLTLNLTEASGMGSIGSPKALEEGVNLGQMTAGAGPFVISPEATVEGSQYTYLPNPNYFDPDAIDFDKVVIKVIGNANTAYAALRSGQVNISYADAANVTAAEDAGLHSTAFPVNVIGMWTSDPNGEIVPALADIRVRQALQYAIDRETTAEAAAPGSGQATVQPVTPDSVGYDVGLESEYPYDIEKAKSLLAEAGYADGFPITVSVAPGSDHVIVAQAIADQLAKVNVEVTLRTPATFTEWLQDVLSGNYAAVVIGLGLNGMPTTMDNLFASPALVNFRDSDYPDIVDLAASAAVLSGDDAEAAWQAVTAQSVEDAYQLPIVTTSSIYLWDDNVSGVDESSLLNPAYLTATE